MNHDYDAIDEAYAIFTRTGPEFGGGLSNHGPMAAEAIAAMHRPDALVNWANRYAKRLEPHPSASAKISEADWREALGKEKRVGDWIVFFDETLKEAPWREALDKWVARLAPGIAAAAFHGVLRTAHAARALGDRENDGARSRTRRGPRLLGGHLSTTARLARLDHRTLYPRARSNRSSGCRWSVAKSAASSPMASRRWRPSSLSAVSFQWSIRAAIFPRCSPISLKPSRTFM